MIKLLPADAYYKKNNNINDTIITALLGTGSSNAIFCKMGWKPCFIAKVSVNSGIAIIVTGDNYNTRLSLLTILRYCTGMS